FIADTLVIQAEGIYETDPDLATLTFDVSAQDKDLKQTYDRASQSMQKILALAEKGGVLKEDIYSGMLAVRPWYDGDRKKKAKSYSVSGQITLKVRDFSKLGPILEGSVADGITDFRSLTYSLANEEAAKQKAVAEAMRRAVGRAQAALEQKGQKVGALRFANLDVKQLAGVSRMDVYQMTQYAGLAQTVSVLAEREGYARRCRLPHHRLSRSRRKSLSSRQCNVPSKSSSDPIRDVSFRLAAARMTGRCAKS
ncbi:MAG TPA: SIMPL domain-containing protein, partial [Candidatus Dormibacteraeota bacterium]|nr:SIMPL domain-containing protein [Candidatus Dormibacteraeota bacterium]